MSERDPMDRDIEQAADAAGRGDTTRPDPAVIERAKQAGLSAARLLRGSRARLSPATPGLLSSLEKALIDVAVEAAAGVIVPATAEQIAAAIEKEPHVNQWYDAGFRRGAKIARSFAASLSAGTAGGNGDG